MLKQGQIWTNDRSPFKQEDRRCEKGSKGADCSNGHAQRKGIQPRKRDFYDFILLCFYFVSNRYADRYWDKTVPGIQLSHSSFFVILLICIDRPHVVSSPGNIVRRINTCQHRMVLIVVSMQPIPPNGLEV